MNPPGPESTGEKNASGDTIAAIGSVVSTAVLGFASGVSYAEGNLKVAIPLVLASAGFAIASIRNALR